MTKCKCLISIFVPDTANRSDGITVHYLGELAARPSPEKAGLDHGWEHKGLSVTEGPRLFR